MEHLPGRLNLQQLAMSIAPYACEYIMGRPEDDAWRIFDALDSAVGSAPSEADALRIVALLNKTTT